MLWVAGTMGLMAGVFFLPYVRVQGGSAEVRVLGGSLQRVSVSVSLFV